MCLNIEPLLLRVTVYHSWRRTGKDNSGLACHVWKVHPEQWRFAKGPRTESRGIGAYGYSIVCICAQGMGKHRPGQLGCCCAMGVHMFDFLS